MTNPHLNIILKIEKLKALALKIRNKMRMLTLAIPVQFNTESPRLKNQARKRN